MQFVLDILPYQQGVILQEDLSDVLHDELVCGNLLQRPQTQTLALWLDDLRPVLWGKVLLVLDDVEVHGAPARSGGLAHHALRGVNERQLDVLGHRHLLCAMQIVLDLWS